MGQGRLWHKLHDVDKRSSHLCSSMHTSHLLPHPPAAHIEPLSNPNQHRSENPHSVHGNLNVPQVHITILRSHAIPASHNPDSCPSAHIDCDARNRANKPNANGNSRSPPSRRDQRWVSDMDEYLAASSLCREEAMACSLLAAGVHWPSAERENRKKKKNKPLSSTCRALNAGTNQSWRGLKKLLSKQFMPFSNRDHHGLHHINTTINKRSLKTLNVGSRKMDGRIQDGANKRDFILGCRKLQGKENIELNGNEIRLPFSIDAETCRSQLGSWEKNCKVQQGKLKEKGLKNRVHILLSKASDVALEVCDILNLE